MLKKAKPIIIWRLEKKPNLFVVLLFLCHKKMHEIQEYHKKFFRLRFRLDLSCTRALYWCFSDFLWFVRLHTLDAMVPQFADFYPSAAFAPIQKSSSIHSWTYDQNHKSLSTSSMSLSHFHRRSVCSFSNLHLLSVRKRPNLFLDSFCWWNVCWVSGLGTTSKQ